mgnify:FL=1
MINRFSHVDRCAEVLAHVSPARWDGLLRLVNTVVETVIKADGQRGYVLCQYLAMLIEGPPTPEHYAKFGRAIDRLLEQRLILGVLMEPSEIPLARFVPKDIHRLAGDPKATPETHPDLFTDFGVRSILLCYMHSPKSIAELNAVLGFNGFVAEGELPSAWA